ncbi:MAG: DUF1801 domain-containing protein [Chloroflexi bacterium]|nr:DUF1801 domain-containing protein [Chloroflexota bacterium]MCC6895202.1 DUF1801 domain-containing protein [Anaerolineae bacterium]
MTQEIDAFLAAYPAEVQTLANKAQEMIAAAVPKAHERLYASYKAVSYLMGETMTEGFAYIAPQKDRINIGFYRGALLPDATGLLEGTGKLLRHVKVRSVGDLEKPALRQLILDSVAELERFLADDK